MKNGSIHIKSIATKPVRFIVGALAATTLLAAAPVYASAQSFDDVTETGAKTKAFSDYSSVYVAPVEMAIPERGSRLTRRTRPDVRDVSSSDQARKAESLHEDLTRQLGRNFDIVDQPGSGTLTVAVTITELRSSRPTIEDLSQNVGLSAVSVYAGGASAVFVISDGDTVLTTISDSYDGSFADGTPRVGIWADADRAFSRWSRNIRRYLARN